MSMILYLGNKLSESGNTPTSVETLGKRISDIGYDVQIRSSVRNIIVRMADMLWAIFKFRRFKPVVMIDTYSTMAFWYAWASGLLAGFLNLKYIVVLRGGDLPNRINKSQRASDMLFNNSFANIAVSGFLMGEMRKRGFPVQMIHNYIDINQYPYKPRKVVGPRLLWVRSFHNIYNPQLALSVLNLLGRNFPNASLCMVGPDKDGSLNECKKMAATLNLDVTFTGKLDKMEWIKLSQNFDIFINTTNVDNTPVSVMEAMALGLPVVTTNAGGIPYLFINDVEGLMVPVNNIEAMTNAILSLLDNPDKTEKISIAARSKAEQWDWSNVSSQWKRLINDAMKNEVK